MMLQRHGEGLKGVKLCIGSKHMASHLTKAYQAIHYGNAGLAEKLLNTRTALMGQEDAEGDEARAFVHLQHFLRNQSPASLAEIIRYATRAVDQDPSVMALAMLGYAEAAAGNKQEALRRYRQALELASNQRLDGAAEQVINHIRRLHALDDKRQGA